jgi:hypothetical protein
MNSACKRIGFVDYRLDNFHADMFLKSIRALGDTRGFEVAGAFALEPELSSIWAKINGVEYLDQLTLLDALVDFYMILAPSNPEVHLDLCSRVFPYRKPVYVDKTFAPNLGTARDIFNLADQNDVAVQTSSALRYTDVQSVVRRAGTSVRHLAVWGGGSSLDEYTIHPVELVVSCLGTDASSVAILGTSDYPLIVMQYDSGRTGVIYMNAKAHVPYQAAVSSDETTEFITVDDSRLFLDATSAILDFFDAGVPQFRRDESLLVCQVLDVIGSSRSHGQVLPLHREDTTRPLPSPEGFLRKRGMSTDMKS